MANNKGGATIQNEVATKVELQDDSFTQQEIGRIMNLSFNLEYPVARKGLEIDVNDFFKSLIKFQNNLIANNIYENHNNKSVVITQAILPISTHIKICDTDYCGIEIQAGDKFSIKLSNSITIESISNE